MNMLKLLPLELKRLLQRRFTWLVIALTAFSPVLGLVLYKPASATTMLSIYLANPAIAGGAAGGILFRRADHLRMGSGSSPSRRSADGCRGLAAQPDACAIVSADGLRAVRFCAHAAGMAAHQQRLIGAVFDLSDYALAYLLFMGLALPLGILAAAAAYQFVDVPILHCCCLQLLRRFP